jgi:hemerythrin-like domain-containing protein
MILLGSTGLGWARAEGASAKGAGQATAPEAEISPTEDLMREHGVLKRLVLVYEEAIRRLDRQEDLAPDAVADAASLIRSFIEDYHEKREEEFLFPRFRQANRLVDLVEVLVMQHRAGRALTETPLHPATLQAWKRAEDRRTLTHALRAFIRMYNPHEARGDTVLFPAFRMIVTPHEYDAPGEAFEQREHQLFGERGFEQIVDQVAAIEKRLGIYDLAQFTPRR